MKNLLESLAIFLVGILSIGIIYLIIQYNMIQDENVLNDVLTELAEPAEEAGKSKTESYLENLEGYEDDEDLDADEVDVTKESTTNTVTIVSEEAENALEDVVEDKTKSSYTENLENYKEAEPAVQEAPPAEDPSGEPQMLEHEEIVDEVGMAIDAALEDL